MRKGGGERAGGGGPAIDGGLLDPSASAIVWHQLNESFGGARREDGSFHSAFIA